MNTYVILACYWLIAITATYITRYYNDKKNAYRKIFATETSLGKRIITHLCIWTLIPLAMPFIIVYLAFTGLNRFVYTIKYKNKPKPVPECKRSFMNKDAVLDENDSSVSISEYNYIHDTEYTLDDVYGKGYEASLTEKERNEIKNSSYGVLNIQESLLESPQTQASITLGQAIVSGDFSGFNEMLLDDVETIIYDQNTHIGKNSVSEYWMGWRERFVVTKKVKWFEVLHSNYYSNSCLQLESMIVHFIMKGNKISKLVLSCRDISGEMYAHHDDLVQEFPFKLEFLKKYLEPLREANEIFEPVHKEHRLPCFSCGQKSENLDWYTTRISTGCHTDMAQVSVCPHCAKVVEYYTEGQFRTEETVVNEIDMLEEYVRCWNTLSIGNLADYLSDDFHYSSFWVFEELDKEDYLNYLSGKFETICRNGSSVKAKLVDSTIIVNQEGKNCAISVKFENNKIVRADMSPASFFGYPDNEDIRPKVFRLHGLTAFFNSTPLLGTKYIDSLPDVEVDKLNYATLKHETKKVKDIVQECDWFYLGHLAKENKTLLEQVKASYKAAADDGFHEAANVLGVLAYNYEGNETEGKRWLYHAAAEGSQNAMINLFTIHWSNEDYQESIAMLSDMFNKKSPSLKCLWNLAFFYYMGDAYPHNTLPQDLEKTKSILSQIATYDKEKICEEELALPDNAASMLKHIESSNPYADNGRDYHYVLRTSVIKTKDVKDKGEVLRSLPSIRLAPGFHLGLHLAEQVGTGDESRFCTYDDSGNVQDNILEHMQIPPTSMGAWQVYMLMTSPTIMPTFWHGAYICRKFVFNENDLDEIPQISCLDLSAAVTHDSLLPKVVLEHDESTGKMVAKVFCHYWNDWKGLVRECATIVISENIIESYKAEDEKILYKYNCGIYF